MNGELKAWTSTIENYQQSKERRTEKFPKRTENSNFRMISIIVGYKWYNPHRFFEIFILMRKSPFKH